MAQHLYFMDNTIQHSQMEWKLLQNTLKTKQVKNTLKKVQD